MMLDEYTTMIHNIFVLDQTIAFNSLLGCMYALQVTASSALLAALSSCASMAGLRKYVTTRELKL
jgi:hypothetical protein